MTVLLDSVDVSGLILENEFGFPNVVSVVDESVDQSPIIYEANKYSGKIRDLIGGQNWGTLERSTLLSVAALTEVKDAVYELNYNSTVFYVRFRSEDGNPIEATRVSISETPSNTERYHSIRIKLMEVQ